MSLVPSIFYLDGLPGRFEGYEDPTYTWNGASVPYFTKRAADLLSAEFNSYDWIRVRYIPSEDVYVAHFLDDGTRYTYEGEDIETIDGMKHLYPLGSGEWLWMTEATYSRRRPRFSISLMRKRKKWSWKRFMSPLRRRA